MEADLEETVRLTILQHEVCMQIYCIGPIRV